MILTQFPQLQQIRVHKHHLQQKNFGSWTQLCCPGPFPLHETVVCMQVVQENDLHVVVSQRLSLLGHGEGINIVFFRK